MKIRAIARLKLIRKLVERNISDTTLETIVQIMVSIREEHGHTEAEAKAEEILSILKTEISEGVVIFSAIEIRGDKRTLVARGHGHMLRNDLLGVLQAASWAARKAFTEHNGGETYIEKE